MRMSMQSSSSSKPSIINESQVIRDFHTNRENTMNTIVSRSVAMAVLKLKEEYFWDNATEEMVKNYYEKCIADLRQQENLSNVTCEFIIANTKESSSSLDRVTVFLSSTNQEETFFLPLKEVLPLVWMALNDNWKYIQHYSGTEEERLQAAEEDRLQRLASFFSCLERMRTEQVCHHGDRNELVFCLNKIYDGIDLIEDARATVLYFLKDWINETFWKKYNSVSLEEKAPLRKALFKWMIHHTPTEVVALLDPEENWKAQ